MAANTAAYLIHRAQGDACPSSPLLGLDVARADYLGPARRLGLDRRRQILRAPHCQLHPLRAKAHPEGIKVDADEDGGGGDDTADALRYLVATRARSVIQRKLAGV